MSVPEQKPSGTRSFRPVKTIVYSIILVIGGFTWYQLYNYRHIEGGPLASLSPAAYNGFDISNITIPRDEVYSGGPIPDGIPAISNPKFVDIGEVDFLLEESLVISFTHEGETRAYPLRILVWHEIVNDTIGGKPVAITYCPLCGTSMVFDRVYGDTTFSFGVSGLLYNSDVLMFDRETESLWSQILMEAVSGPSVDQSLNWLPSTEMTWGSWKKIYPTSKVLSKDTGFTRNYNHDAYSLYMSSDNIMFPVNVNRIDRPMKSWVIGIQVGDSYKAYPLEILEEFSGEPIADTVNNVTIEVLYNKESQAVQVTNTQTKTTIPHVKLYWFAWQAFYPDTELYR